VKLYESKGGGYEGKADSKNEPKKGAPQKKADKKDDTKSAKEETKAEESEGAKVGPVKAHLHAELIPTVARQEARCQWRKEGDRGSQGRQASGQEVQEGRRQR
jgi:hypothetical protein